MFIKLMILLGDYSRQMERNYTMEFVFMTSSYEYWNPRAIFHCWMNPINIGMEKQLHYYEKHGSG